MFIYKNTKAIFKSKFTRKTTHIKTKTNKSPSENENKNRPNQTENQ